MMMPFRRIANAAILIKPATILSFHRALVRKKYLRLFGSKYKGKPGPKGPTPELIKAIVSIKQRSPRFGCPKISQMWFTPPCGNTTNPAQAIVMPLLVILHKPHERQPVERGFLQMQIHHSPIPLGIDLHRSIASPHHRLWNSKWIWRWTDGMPNVQSGSCRTKSSSLSQH